MKKLLILICLIFLIPASGWGLTDVEVGIGKNTGDNAVNATYDDDGDGDLTDESWWTTVINTFITSTGVTYENLNANSDVGTGSSQVAAGDDSRFTDARTPTTHASTHATGQSDAIAPADIGAEPADANILKVAELNSEALLESVSQTQIATESEAQGYVNKEQLDTIGDVVDVAATLASNDSDDMLVTAGAIIDYVISYCTDFITASDVDDNVTRFICIASVQSDTAVTVADGTVGIPITLDLNGWDIVDAYANVRTKGVTGTTDIQIRKQSGATDVDVLSTKLTLGDEYYCSDETINTSNDALATGDMLFVDVDAVHSGTAPNGLSVVIVVQLP